MENNDSNLKPQATGGLKLMTVFIAVLALHVLVIGGVTVYHLMSGGGSDLDLTDKGAKDTKIAPDGSVVMDQSADPAAQNDKTASSDNATPAPAIEQTPPADNGTAPAQGQQTAATAPGVSTPTGPVVNPPQPPAPAPAATPVAASDTVDQAEPTTAPPLESEATVTTAGITYTVKMNDTIEKIAHRHHTTVAKLKAANGLNGEVLHVGERLIIPGKTAVASASATPDTAVLTNLSGSPAPAPEEAPAATPAVLHTASTGGHHTYVVVKGDTLSRIAHHFHVTTKALIAANEISDPSKLAIGQKLNIPSHHGTSASATATMAKPAPVAAPVAEPASTPAAEQPAQPKSTGQLANFVQ